MVRRMSFPSAASLARAHALIDRVPLVDGHNDLPYVIRAKTAGDVLAYDLTRVHQDGDTDIPRLKAGRLSGQFWAAFVPTRLPNSARVTLEQIDVALRIIAAHPDVFMPATRASDVGKARRQGRIASFITVESGIGLENSLSPLRVWHAAGVRLLTLCHNETLDWIDSATDAPRAPGGGLSKFGEAVVLECNRLGIVIDLSHVAPHAMHRVLDVSRAPVVWSHSNVRALSDHPRNLPDDVLARVAAHDGLVMATFVPEFISQETWDWEKPGKPFGRLPVQLGRDNAASNERGPKPRADLAGYIRHIDYLVKEIGARHIGIGSDFFGGSTPDGLEDVACFPRLVAGLLERGYTERKVAGFMSGNLLRTMRAVERVARDLRGEAPRVGRMDDFDR